MTPPATYPLHLYRGDSYRWQFRLWQDAAKTQPVDLTGASVTAEIRDRPGSTLAVIALPCTVTLPNVIDMAIAAATSKGVPSYGAWDLQIAYPSGEVGTVLAGPVRCTADVTASALAR
jgi:hypothetical protein